jgi:serine/threonine protein kinase
VNRSPNRLRIEKVMCSGGACPPRPDAAASVNPGATMAAGGPVLAPLTDSDPRDIGPFRLGGRLGSGGMGTVYLGFGVDDRPVAVKVPSPALANDARFRARFRREAVAVQMIDSGSVAAVVAADTEADAPWLATEFVQGATLLDAVSGRGPLAARLVVGFAAGLADGLVAIHAVGVVHRDLKPANIVLAWDGPKIIDFGVALTTRTLLGVDSGADADVTVARTQDGQRLGTFVWMAPEQLRGDAVGPAADVFAWGACLTYATTGHGPFRAEGAFEIIARIQRDEPDLDGVPPELVDLVRATLAKDPDARPTATELVSRLLNQTVNTPSESDRAVETALVSWVAQPPTPSPLDAPPVAAGAGPTGTIVLSGSAPVPASGRTEDARRGTDGGRAAAGGAPKRQPAGFDAQDSADLPTLLPARSRGAGGYDGQDSADLPTQLRPPSRDERRGAGAYDAQDSADLPTLLPSRTRDERRGVGGYEGQDSADLQTQLRSPLRPRDGDRPAAWPAGGDDPRGPGTSRAVVTGPGRPSATVRVVLAFMTVLLVAGAVTLALVLANASSDKGSSVKEVGTTSSGRPAAHDSGAPSAAASEPATSAAPAAGSPEAGPPAARRTTNAPPHAPGQQPPGGVQQEPPPVSNGPAQSTGPTHTTSTPPDIPTTAHVTTSPPVRTSPTDVGASTTPPVTSTSSLLPARAPESSGFASDR